MKTKSQIVPLTFALVVAVTMLFSQCRAQAQSLSQDFKNIYNDSLGSTNSTYAFFGEKKLTGDAYKIGGVWLYNANQYIAAGGGIAHEWSPSGAAPSANFNLTVGVQFSMAIAPLSVIGYTNEFAHPFVGTFVGTPFSGQNSGSLMNSTRTGCDFHFYQFAIRKTPVILSGGAYYGNETGTGYYAGNWVGGYLRLSYGQFSSPTLSDDMKANAWTTLAENQ